MANARNTNIAPAPNHTPTIADTVPKWLNTLLYYWDLASLQLMQLLGPLVRQEGSILEVGMYLDLHGARVDPSLKRLAYSRMDS